VLVSGGAQVNLPKQLVLEAAVMGVIFRPRTGELPGFEARYSGWAVLTGLAFSYRPGS
jgi:hypothetical protein